jgi:hypothetical protein
VDTDLVCWLSRTGVLGIDSCLVGVDIAKPISSERGTKLAIGNWGDKATSSGSAGSGFEVSADSDFAPEVIGCRPRVAGPMTTTSPLRSCTGGRIRSVRMGWDRILALAVLSTG